LSDNNFEDDMEELAAEIAVKAGAADVSLHDQIDAFKALMPYLALLKKGKKNDDEEEDEEEDDMPNFNNFQKNIHAVK